MKLFKKFSKGIIAVVICLLLATTAWATEQIIVSYTATLNDAVLCVNVLDEAKTITLTAQAGEMVAMDAFTAQVKVPEGWTITGIANTRLNFGEGNFNLANGMILWYAEDAENVDNELFATATIEVPAGTPVGEYEIKFEIIDISRDWGMPWESGKILTATLTVGEHADGGDKDHLCDSCQGAVDGEDCVYVPGEPVWSEDNSTCTVVGTCACDETATATAEVTSSVTAGTCQTEEVTTYTATFTESWITEKTVTKEVKGEKDADVHVGEQKTEYTNNGDDHTVKVSYAGCGHVVSETNEDHTYVDGKCVCGAEKTEEPSTGLKGDVDLDGEVTSADVTRLLEHVAGINPLTDTEALANGEVTGDGELTSADVTKILEYVAGIITSLG